MKNNYLYPLAVFALLPNASSAQNFSLKQFDESKISVEALTLQNQLKGTLNLDSNRFYRIVDNEKGIVCYVISTSSSSSTSVGVGGGAGASIQCLKQ